MASPRTTSRLAAAGALAVSLLAAFSAVAGGQPDYPHPFLNGSDKNMLRSRGFIYESISKVSPDQIEAGGLGGTFVTMLEDKLAEGPKWRPQTFTAPDKFATHELIVSAVLPPGENGKFASDNIRYCVEKNGAMLGTFQLRTRDGAVLKDDWNGLSTASVDSQGKYISACRDYMRDRGMAMMNSPLPGAKASSAGPQ